MRRLRPGSVEAHVLRGIRRARRVRAAQSRLSMRSADADDLRALFGGALLDGLGVRIADGKAGLVDVGDVKLRLRGDEEELAGDDASHHR